MLNPAGEKKCPRCDQTKLAVGNFYKTNRPTGGGFSGYCIDCTKTAALTWQKALPLDRRKAKNKTDHARKTPEQLKKHAAWSREWVKRNPEKQRAWQQAYKNRDPERRRAMNAIHNNHTRATRLGLPSGFAYLDWCEVREAFNHSCAYCGAQEALLDLDHLQPMKLGGPNTVGNVVPACRICNSNKGAKTVDEFARERGFDLAALRSRAEVPKHGE